MDAERTEGLGLAQALRISVGGQLVELRTLSMDESDAWLRQLTGAIDIDVSGIGADADSLAALLSVGARAGVELIAAYDVGGRLPEGWRSRISKREVKEALDAMADAEDPFEEGAVRLVAEVFGAPSRFLATLSRTVTSAVDSHLAEQQSGASAPGASTTTSTSVPAGAASGSSSSGSTDTSGRTRKPRPIAMPSPTG